MDIIKNYTLESGVRELERLLDKIIRNIIIDDIKPSQINETLIRKILGNKIYETVLKEEMTGGVNLLGVNPLGGQIINVQSLLVPSEEDLIITGNVGERLIDSVKIIISYLKNAGYIEQKPFKNEALHLNFELNYQLDGYSGSLGIAASIISLLNKKKISSNTAFIGGLDLYGRVLKVSSLKEKIITAYNNGIKTIYLPEDNKNNLKNIPEFILKDLNLIYISKYADLHQKLFTSKKKS